jgi:hypothetical protein
MLDDPLSSSCSLQILVVGWRERLLMPRVPDLAKRAAREKYDEAFSGNSAAHKYRVNMLV